MFASEVQSRTEKKNVLVITDMAEMGGRVKKSFNHLGLVSAELPLLESASCSKADKVAYISPDRDTEATGHVETTTGASLVRSLLG